MLKIFTAFAVMLTCFILLAGNATAAGDDGVYVFSGQAAPLPATTPPGAKKLPVGTGGTVVRVGTYQTAEPPLAPLWWRVAHAARLAVTKTTVRFLRGGTVVTARLRVAAVRVFHPPILKFGLRNCP